MDVLCAELRLVHIPGRAFAGALVHGIGGDGDEALSGKPLGVKPCYLFLHAAVGMGNDDGGVLPAGVIPGGRVNVGGNPEAVQGVVNGMDIDFPGDVFRDGTPVHKAEGIGRSGLGHAWQGQEGQNGKLCEECFHGRGPFSVCGGAEAHFPGSCASVFIFSDASGTPVCFSERNIGTGPYGSYLQSVMFFARSALSRIRRSGWRFSSRLRDAPSGWQAQAVMPDPFPLWPFHCEARENRI